MSDIKLKIRKELAAKHSEEVKAEEELRYKWHSGMGVYDILQDVERIGKRRVELDTALKILEEFEKKC